MPGSGQPGAGEIDPAMFAALLRPTTCAVSLAMTIDPADRDIRAPGARLRGLVDTARLMLAKREVAPEQAEALLAGLESATASIDLATHRAPGLAVFAAAMEDGLHTAAIPLPNPVPEAAIVGTCPHIKPLLPILSATRRFYLLALSKHQAKLWLATPFSCTELPLNALPTDAQAELDSLADGGAERDALAEARMAMIVADHRRVSFAVKAVLKDDPAPLVLAADPHVAGQFMQDSGIRQLSSTPLHLNPFGLSAGELHAKALELMEPAFHAEVDGILEQVRARLGTAEPTVGIRLEEILQGATEARVDAVVVAEDEALWGRFEPGAIVLAHGHQGPGDEDLLNQAAVLALRNGARAFAVPRERLPRQASAVALYRF